MRRTPPFHHPAMRDCRFPGELMREDTVFKPLAHGRFRFRCHPGIACFTRCCAKLRLLLTPYDVVRLKHRLALRSQEFLIRYAELCMERSSRFPMLKLKMREDAGGRCPFVTPEGCSVYQDRPVACRIYPVGRAARKHADQTGPSETFFLVEEAHCLGFREQREWKIQEWLQSEGVAEYSRMNEGWLEIVTAGTSLGDPGTVARKMQMFSMASYNLDRFRDFLFEGRFFHLFRVPRAERLRDDDTELLQFAFRWLRFALFAEPTLELSSGAGPGSRVEPG